MKKTFTLLAALLMAAFISQGQVLIVKWTFPTGAATDSIADGGLPVNLDKAIHTEGGTSAIDFSKNGVTTKAAQATGWNDGAGSKCWVVKVNTVDHDNLKISSKMQSGGNNPGPKDYKLQFKTSEAGNWQDVPGAIITVANDWETGVLDSVPLPADCNGQANLHLRWIMTSNTNSQGGTVEAGGINKIDDIYITGKVASTGLKENQPGLKFSLSPNPSSGRFVVFSDQDISALSIYNTSGKCIYSRDSFDAKTVTVDVDNFQRGTYFVRVITANGNTGNQKLLIL
jgi:hypothetical protein